MSISQISPNSLATSSSYVNPSAKTAQTDTVTISQQALQMTAGNNSKPEDTKNSTSNQQQSPQQQPQQQQQGGFSTTG